MVGLFGYKLYPIGSMYAIYGDIYHQYTPNVSIYTIHASYGYVNFKWLAEFQWLGVINLTIKTCDFMIFMAMNGNMFFVYNDQLDVCRSPFPDIHINVCLLTGTPRKIDIHINVCIYIWKPMVSQGN